MQNIDNIIELIYKAKGSDNSEVESIAKEINKMYISRDDIDNIIECEIIRKFGKNFNELSTDTRIKEYSLPRQISMYLMQKYHILFNTKKTLKDISADFNKSRNVTYYYCNVINNYLETDKEIRSIINEIEENINEAI